MAVDLDVPPEARALWAELNEGVVKFGDPALRRVAKPVLSPTPETRELVQRMTAAMHCAHGVGLAAPQLGISERVIVYQLPEENQPVRAILNPKIVSRKGEQIGPEGCLSIPLLQGEVKRAAEIVVKGMDPNGRPLRRRASEFEARVIQHEVDHLDGVLFIDKAEPGTLKWHLGDEPDEAEEPELRE